MTQVYAIETSEGWVLQTADDARDVLAGPVQDEAEIRKLAKECDLKIVTTQVLSFSKELVVRNRKPGDLFRIEGYWYRLKEHNGKKSTVNVVGENRMIDLDGNTKITEISVTSKS